MTALVFPELGLSTLVFATLLACCAVSSLADMPLLLEGKSREAVGLIFTCLFQDPAQCLVGSEMAEAAKEWP